ncbi:hypothetical protein JAAARDRAFT_32130 [Jaapia argillacea MUCL 33604]|uniref:N-acetyltransferase domain-containing protein n=1 Tax=Jaapia argillacea MUCL 33604 TaxID=933084 RepID=A0A067QCA0_9AGAM|nr:hypothetical protein JAAARDRAFT_32130 [Jaapia argillacea MUCL 33604]
MEPTIRPATLRDLDQIVPLFLASLDTSLPDVTFSTRPEYEPHKVYDVLKARLFVDDGSPVTTHTYVVVTPSDTEEIMGYATVKMTGGPGNESPELDHIFVKSDSKGAGFGSRLMRYLQAEWPRGLRVHVFKRNEAGIGFYRKWGFTLVGEEELVSEKEIVCMMKWELEVEGR